VAKGSWWIGLSEDDGKPVRLWRLTNNALGERVPPLILSSESSIQHSILVLKSEDQFGQTFNRGLGVGSFRFQNDVCTLIEIGPHNVDKA
jgi:hypothetical protein